MLQSTQNDIHSYCDSTIMTPNFSSCQSGVTIMGFLWCNDSAVTITMDIQTYIDTIVTECHVNKAKNSNQCEWILKIPLQIVGHEKN